MDLPRQGHLLRIFIGESDRHPDGTALYEWIVREARRLGLAGATAVRGLRGFGANSRIHTTKILRLSSDLPVIVEVVDTRERIDELLERVEPCLGEGLATIEKVEVRFYRGAE